MGGSSFLNAFRLLGRKPVLLLLLLPLQLAVPLLNKLISVPEAALGMEYYSPYAATDAFMASAMSQMAYALGILLLMVLVLLLAGFLLIPPAMELLHDGAQGKDTPGGWYGRGLRKHWWKPVTLGAIETGILTILGVILYFVMIFGVLMAAPDLMSTAGDYDFDNNLSAAFGVLAAAAIPILIFLFFMLVIVCFFAMLLPATADRGFGASFRVLFAKAGFVRLLKTIGVYFLVGLFSSAINLLFIIGYLFFSGSLSSPGEWANTLTSYSESWTAFGASAVLSFTMLFKYAYIFCVFQEIKNKEAAALPPPSSPVIAGEGSVAPQAFEGGDPS